MRSHIAGLAALTIALAGGAVAQTAAPAPPAAAPAAAAAPIPSATGKASVEKTTIGDLVGNASSKAVLSKDYPELLAYPGLDDIKGMTLRDVSKYPQANLDDARLASIQKDLNAAPGP